MEQSTLRAIVELLPRYAHTRRAGWTPESVTPRPITLPEYLLLRRVAIERVDAPIPYAELHANALNPYCTVDPFLEQLPRLVELGLLDRSGDDYALTPLGDELLTRGEQAANDYTAGRIRLPPDDLSRLASTLHDLAERLRRAPEPAVKAHQDRVPRLRRFDPRQTPQIQLEHALYALQRARDDAHISAWRAAGLRGATVELLSHVWAGNASTSAELVELTRNRMRPEDVTTLVDELKHEGYVAVGSTAVTITDRGRKVRGEIERETDRVYYAPWQKMDAEWVCNRLERLTAVLARQPMLS